MFVKNLRAAIVAIAISGGISSANAATSFYSPGDPQFQVAGNPFSGSVSATIGHSGIVSGSFTDIFNFTVGQTGLGSGSLSTSASIFKNATDLDITSVTVNGLSATRMASPNNLYEAYYIIGVPITIGVLNNITVSGVSRGNGSFGGNLTFVPLVTALPEAPAWLMMILGFGLSGASLRNRRRDREWSLI